MMGVAAYNRGSKHLSAQTDAAQPSHNMMLLRDLSTVSALAKGVTPFGAGVIRPGSEQQGGWHFMNKQETGWSSSSYWYPTLSELAQRWHIIFTGIGSDQYSWFYTFAPRGKA